MFVKEFVVVNRRVLSLNASKPRENGNENLFYHLLPDFLTHC